MKFATVAEIAVLALAGVIMLSSVPASAQPTSRECWALADQVKAALASHSGASTEARDHYRDGQLACTQGYNAQGVAQLQAAMKALGNQSAQR